MNMGTAFNEVSRCNDIKQRTDVKDESLLETMSADMIRKDFGVFRVQDNLMNIFDNCEIFSKSQDEFLSVEHTLELGSSTNKTRPTIQFKELVYDAVITVAFDGLKKGCHAVKYYQKSAGQVAKLIFKSCKEKSSVDSIVEFQIGFTNCFPHLNVSAFNQEILMPTAMRIN